MNEKPLPPRWIDSLLDDFAPSELTEEIKGDIYELFNEDLKTSTVRAARRKYFLNALGFFVRDFFWRRRILHANNPFYMIKNYFLMARRSLMAYKGNTVINVMGLVVGISSALVILNVIRYELSFDSFHTDSKRIYRVVRVTGQDINNVETAEYRTGISNPIPAAIQAEASGLEKITTVQNLGGSFIEVLDKSGTSLRRFQEERGCAAVQPSFFSMFDFKGTEFKWISGSPDALKEPYSIVLSRTMAAKYFEDSNPIGMTMRFGRQVDCKVTGMMEDLPSNSDFPFGILISYSTLEALQHNRNEDWTSVDDENQAYLIPVPGVSKQEFEKQIAKVHAAHTPSDISASRHYLLQELKDVHFDPRFGNYNGRTITRRTLLGLGIIAIFLLLTGSINYINLATAQSTMRAMEIGLRKVMGSSQMSLIFQFLAETFLVVLIAALIAFGVSEILLLNLQSLLNMRFEISHIIDPFVLKSLSLIILIVTLFSAFYPAMIISRFNPIAALRNKFGLEKIQGLSLRKVLVVAQFAITQMLVVGTFIVVLQMKFFQDTDLGFNREAVVTVDLPDRDPAKLKILEDQLRLLAPVSGITASYTLPSGLHRRISSGLVSRLKAASFADQLNYEFQSVDTSYLGFYGIKLLAGRNFHTGDSADYVLINKSLARNLEIGSPEEAVGKQIWMGHTTIVIGVFDDFFNSLKEPVGNMAMFLNPKGYTTVSIRLNGQAGALAGNIEQVGKVWSSVFADFIFTYEFLDDNIKAYYVQEKKYAELFQLFAGVFLAIGCLGLYGLITFVVNRKGKEIAIRKVMGASAPGILYMFSREYIRLIVISFLISIPIAYYVVNSWLNNFAQHIVLYWWLFLIPGFLVLLIALSVIAVKSLRAANRNPIINLRHE